MGVPDDYMVKKSLPIPGVEKAVCIFWGLMPGPADMPWWLLGTNVLRHTNVVFGAYGDKATICPRSDGEDPLEKKADLNTPAPQSMKFVLLFALVGASLVTTVVVAITRAMRGQSSVQVPLVDTYARF